MKADSNERTAQVLYLGCGQEIEDRIGGNLNSARINSKQGKECFRIRIAQRGYVSDLKCDSCQDAALRAQRPHAYRVKHEGLAENRGEECESGVELAELCGCL